MQFEGREIGGGEQLGGALPKNGAYFIDRGRGPLLAGGIAGRGSQTGSGDSLNHSRSSYRRGRKPSRGRGERFNRGSPTQFDFANSEDGAVET